MKHLVGGLGTLCVLMAYFLVSRGRVKSQSYAFQGINVLGASLLLGYAVLMSAWATFALNIVWLAIGGISLGRIFAQGRRSS